MSDNNDASKPEADAKTTASQPDETTAVMVYGNLRIVDVQTNEILVNKRA